ncbi:hypothetical protein [Natronoglycomyces albus]|uniref:DegT/DnrJ/EryC1/StrS aminotransferase family protein n=1 Tax=Natronoglycomyces albus TaxID=2811108 RepID=A0A895XKS4_9ACTN|nr:hypothetical protein [Natronoglycomyces albus]QSB04163.1 hypothetical protein JQS30_10095 [Natronoglycomyces albus]
MDNFDTAVILTRVMTSGVVMSIEKSDRELPGLERLLSKQTGRKHVSLVNTSTAAIHAAVAGQAIGYGDTISLPKLDDKTRAFLSWLGITAIDTGEPCFEVVSLDAQNAHTLPDRAAEATAPVLVVDLSGLGFGPAAAVLTDDEQTWARAERLKIFGAFDLRTMWTQEESNPDLIPGVQFNYRLSPLVAACVRMALSRAHKNRGQTNATTPQKTGASA